MSIPISQMTAVWNDAGLDFTAIKMVITDTAHDTGSYMIDLTTTVAGGYFRVNPDGDLAISGDADVAGDLAVGGDLSFSDGGILETTITISSATFEVDKEDTLFVEYTLTGSVAITMSTASAVAGRKVCIVDSGLNAGTNNIVMDTEGAELINGSATATINSDGSSITLRCDGTNWSIT